MTRLLSTFARGSMNAKVRGPVPPPRMVVPARTLVRARVVARRLPSIVVRVRTSVRDKVVAKAGTMVVPARTPVKVKAVVRSH